VLETSARLSFSFFELDGPQWFPHDFRIRCAASVFSAPVAFRWLQRADGSLQGPDRRGSERPRALFFFFTIFLHYGTFFFGFLRWAPFEGP